MREADGFSLESGIAVFGLAELPERYKTLEVARYAPGYIAIGDDSGPDALTLSLSATDLNVYRVSQGDMSPGQMRLVAHDIALWLSGLLTFSQRTRTEYGWSDRSQPS